MSAVARILGDGERGQAFVYDRELIAADSRTIQEFERALTEEAIARRLDVWIEREHYERRYRIVWAPTEGEPGVIEP